jgi:hypothetical protein
MARIASMQISDSNKKRLMRKSCGGFYDSSIAIGDEQNCAPHTIIEAAEKLDADTISSSPTARATINY